MLFRSLQQTILGKLGGCETEVILARMLGRSWTPSVFWWLGASGNWKQRNARVFANVNKQKSVEAFIYQILDEWSMWKRAKPGGRGISRRE